MRQCTRPLAWKGERLWRASTSMRASARRENSSQSLRKKLTRIVKGSYVLEEVEFFHKPSKTAIICDLIQRHPEADMTGIKGFMMKLDGLVGKNGSTPRDWRFTFWPFGKAEVQKSRDSILNWNADRLIIAHGECAESNASEVIRKALYWI
ncbi:hypothetical protein ACHAWF_009902 [Thalassiosira exigua]